MDLLLERKQCPFGHDWLGAAVKLTDSNGLKNRGVKTVSGVIKN